MIHLASQSPQRSDLLTRAGVPFAKAPSVGDEETIQGLPLQVLAIERARVKGRGARVRDGIVLAADTEVGLGTRILGKAPDEAAATAMLQSLSGTTHTVVTGHWMGRIVAGEVVAEAAALAIAKVTMRPLKPEEIAAYVASGEWRGRAGAYAIQEKADRFVVDVQGAMDTVIGLNVAIVAKLHREVADAELPGYRP